MSSPKELRFVRLDHIRLNPHQPRRFFDEAELMELAESIKAVGLIHPPLVRQTENPSQFELVAGERRFRASKLAGLTEIPVVVCNTTRFEAAQAALIENIQRVDLNAIEIAKALKRLMEEFHLNQEEVAQHIGKKRSTIANYLRLLTLPQTIQDSLIRGSITMGHAKAILSQEEMENQFELHKLILRDKLNVREAEMLSQKFNFKTKKRSLGSSKKDFYLEELCQRLQYKIGTKVSIRGKGSRGCISFEYFSLDDLDRLLNMLGIQNH